MCSPSWSPDAVPRSSDGYKAFIGWVGESAWPHGIGGGRPGSRRPHGDRPSSTRSTYISTRPGSATWSRASPGPSRKFQFVFTSHSPLVASSVQAANVVVTGTDSAGLPNLGRMQESLYGRSIEAVLLSPYFGLDSARPAGAREATAELAAKVGAAPGGDVDSAEAFLRQLADPLDRIRNASPRPKGADGDDPPRAQSQRPCARISKKEDANWFAKAAKRRKRLLRSAFLRRGARSGRARSPLSCCSSRTSARSASGLSPAGREPHRDGPRAFRPKGAVAAWTPPPGANPYPPRLADASPRVLLARLRPRELCRRL